MFKRLLSFLFPSSLRAKKHARQAAAREARLAKAAVGTMHAFGPQVAMRIVRMERARARVKNSQ